MQGHLRSVALAAALASTPLASCGRAPDPLPGTTAGPAPASATPTLVSGPAGSAPLTAQAPPDDFTRIPKDAAAEARRALAALQAAPAADSPAHLAFRRALVRGELFFRERGFMAEALFGSGLIDETGGAAGRLEMALVEGDRQAISEAAAEVDRALQLLADSHDRSPARRQLAVSLLPRAAFALGAALAGSRPGASQTEPGVIADAQGLLDAVEQGARAYSTLVSPSLEFTDAANRAYPRMQEIRTALAAAEKKGELAGRADLVMKATWLAADLRGMLGPGAWRPYLPRRESGRPAAEEPIGVLTLPILRRAAPRPTERQPATATQASSTNEDELARVGERLFSDKALSPSGTRSCATCHLPAKGYADGKPRPPSLDPATPRLRHTPTLLYATYHAAQFWDGRALTSEKQALLVMHSRAEMGGTEGVFPRPGAATVEEAARALVAFQSRRLAPGSSPLDRFAAGDESALTAEDRAGFDVFAGKGRCARCHVPPSFGGSHPPDFATAVYAALGVPVAPAGKSLDPDEGRGAVTRQPLDRHAFKTPTVRDVAKTAPYFHNGAFPTLESVVDFYDKGGGRGLGLDVPHQDPDVRPLRLTPAERQALLRFLRVALTD